MLDSFDMILDGLTCEVRVLAENITTRKGHGRPCKNTVENHEVANVSLTDFDIENHHQVIICEAKETLSLGKLLGEQTIGSEMDIFKYIANIIQGHEKDI
ncbi:hypothetical protein V6N13_123900 [Hibiscus sabdariffa]|uniref:Uncharacterized protein n=1 Tax=Hibiscus sabdariffa TaxID=183260 RepID=A0ABR2ALA8_9ROSI